MSHRQSPLARLVSPIVRAWDHAQAPLRGVLSRLAHASIIGGFTAGPVLCLAGAALMPLRTPLQGIAPDLFGVGAAWPLFSLIIAHLRRTHGRSVVPSAPLRVAGHKPTFGELLRAFRLTYVARTVRGVGRIFVRMSTAQRPPLGIAELVARLAQLGYGISVEAYRALEDSERLPERPQQFLVAIQGALALGPKERGALMRAMARRVLADELGEAWADECLDLDGREAREGDTG
jgi:hypothetical protein